MKANRFLQPILPLHVIHQDLGGVERRYASLGIHAGNRMDAVGAILEQVSAHGFYLGKGQAFAVHLDKIFHQSFVKHTLIVQDGPPQSKD